MLILTLLAGLLAAPATAPDDPGLHAERLTPHNISVRRVGGPDAIAGIGDWVIGNGTICAAISGATHSSDFSGYGGALIDLGHCGGQDDQFSLFQPTLNLGRSNTLPIVGIEARRGESEARITVVAQKNGVRLQADYRVDLERPRTLRLELRARRIAKGPKASVLGMLTLHPRGSLRVFSAETATTSGSIGFRHPALDPADLGSVFDAFRRDDLHVLVGDDRVGPGIAYGLQVRKVSLMLADGRTVGLPWRSTTGEDFSLIGAFTERFWVSDERGVGALKIGQTLLMDLERGEELIVDLDWHVGARADVASVTDRLHPDARQVRGEVDDPDARIHVARRDGTPVTLVRPDDSGRFALRLPDGTFRLEARAPGGRNSEREIVVAGQDVNLDPMRLSAAAGVRLPANGPMRLIFVGEGGTPDPRFGDDLLGYTFGGVDARSAQLANYVTLGGLADDPGKVNVPPGNYRVIATRGPEFDHAETRIEALAGETVELAIDPLRRAFETPGWIASDLHVHSSPSWDSALSVDDRLRSFLAEGGEVLVTTEHNRIVDFAPRIAELEIGDRVVSVVGVEATSTEPSEEVRYTFGHANAFPVPFRPQAHRGGAPAAQGKRLRELIDAIERFGTDAIVQLNHPRSRNGGRAMRHLFTHLSVRGKAFDPSLPLDAPRNRPLIEPDPRSRTRDLDFHALELLNGHGMNRYRRTRADWFSLLLQGEIRTGTANSDSHRHSQIVALPRNYVRVKQDRPESMPPAAFFDAIRSGRSQATTGPYLQVRLGDSGIGDRFVGGSGELAVHVLAASWVPVSRARVYVNARVVTEKPLAPGESVRIPLDFDRDSFVVVEVEGDADATYREIAPRVPPFAITNPIFVDADGDGRWNAPGLGDPPPKSIAEPLSLGPADPNIPRKRRRDPN